MDAFHHAGFARIERGRVVSRPVVLLGHWLHSGGRSRRERAFVVFMTVIRDAPGRGHSDATTRGRRPHLDEPPVLVEGRHAQCCWCR